MVTRQAKICGLSTEETVIAAINAGANYVGFVFYPPSPRNISIESAQNLASLVSEDVKKVGVFVNPKDELLLSVLAKVDLDIIQLHGNESVERIQYLQQRFSKKIMKAVAIASVSDISRAREYEKTADMLLFDAKAPKDLENALPGGNGLQFDWTLIAGNQWKIPWMLSGGLDASNVAQAVHISGAMTVDVSSGVENEPGNKDIKKIKSFMAALLASKNASINESE